MELAKRRLAIAAIPSYESANVIHSLSKTRQNGHPDSSSRLHPNHYSMWMCKYVERGLESRLECEDMKRGFGLVEAAEFAKKEFLGKDEEKPAYPYTHLHDGEVGLLAYILTSELKSNGKLPCSGLTKNIVSVVQVAGILHDIGKTYLPRGLLGMELGGRSGDKTIEGRRLTSLEREFIRWGHILAGTELLENMALEHKKIIIGCVGCHHVNYDGQDHLYSPSYPGIWKGADLPIHKRILKICDVVSARLTRFYRQHYVKRNEIEVRTLEDSIAFALSVSGTEMDPKLLPFLLTGIYNIPADEATRLSNIAPSLRAHERSACPDFLKIHKMTKEIARERPVKFSLYATIRNDRAFIAYIRPDNRKKLEAYLDELKGGSSLGSRIFSAYEVHQFFGDVVINSF